MNLKKKYKNVLQWFKDNMPVAETELQYRSPFELMVAVILSAQCTDKRVNMVTPPFFQRFPTPEKLADSDESEVYEYIRSVTYPNSKSKYLIASARQIVSDFHGKLPEQVNELLKLPGIGRKSANVIAAVAFNKAAMPVDTHVFRVAARIGLTVGAKTPSETERQLVKHIPEAYLSKAHHWLILHGRYICVARKPKCDECGLRPWCDYYRGLSETKKQGRKTPNNNHIK